MAFENLGKRFEIDERRVNLNGVSPPAQSSAPPPRNLLRGRGGE
jgi:hypothetical protein